MDGEAGRAQYNDDGTFTPIMEENEGGSSDVIIDETVNGDYTYTDKGDYSYNVVG